MVENKKPKNITIPSGGSSTYSEITRGQPRGRGNLLKSPLFRLTRTKRLSSSAVGRNNTEKIPITATTNNNSIKMYMHGRSDGKNHNSSVSNDVMTKIIKNNSSCERKDRVKDLDNNNIVTNKIEQVENKINNSVIKLDISDIESNSNKDLPLRKRPLHASTHLSIVVTRGEVVVEYHDKDEESGEQKQSSPHRQPSTYRNTKPKQANETLNSAIVTTFSPHSQSNISHSDTKITTMEESKGTIVSSVSSSKRSIVKKGILKRRNSRITYHHPQRTLPPPNPPPGYDVKSLWRKDYSMHSVTTGHHQQRLRFPHAKRVSFDEASMTEQLQRSHQRRRTRHKRREAFGMLATAMPAIFAVSILLATSLVPLPQSPSQPKASTSPGREDVRLSKPPIFDVASRMWEYIIDAEEQSPTIGVSIRESSIDKGATTFSFDSIWSARKPTSLDLDLTAKVAFGDARPEDERIFIDQEVTMKKEESTVKSRNSILRALSHNLLYDIQP